MWIPVKFLGCQSHPLPKKLLFTANMDHHRKPQLDKIHRSTEHESLAPKDTPTLQPLHLLRAQRTLTRHVEKIVRARTPGS